MSPADIAGPLQLLADARPPINILGISTSAPDDESGELGLILDDNDIEPALALLSDYRARKVEEGPELYVDQAADAPGGLLAAVRRARDVRPGSKIKDVAIAVDAKVHSVNPDGSLLRDPNTGEIVHDPLGPHVHGHLVHFFFEGTLDT